MLDNRQQNLHLCVFYAAQRNDDSGYCLRVHMLVIRVWHFYDLYLQQSYLSKLSISFCCTSRSMTMGCWHGLALSNFRKYGLHADNTTLWAVNEHPSHANVTSTKSSSSRKCRNDERILAWKSFHRSEYCCSGHESPPIGAAVPSATGNTVQTIASLRLSTAVHACATAERICDCFPLEELSPIYVYIYTVRIRLRFSSRVLATTSSSFVSMLFCFCPTITVLYFSLSLSCSLVLLFVEVFVVF